MRLSLSFLFLQIFTTLSFADHEFRNRDIGNGQALYLEQCAACHGANLEGQPNWQDRNSDRTLPAPPHDETGHTWHHDNELLFNYTKLGGEGALKLKGIEFKTSGMPAFSDILSDNEIWDVLAYIQSTWPNEIKEIQSQRNRSHN